MNPRLFGCSTTILDNVLVVGTPSLGKKGCIHTYKLSERDVIDTSEPVYALNGHIDDGFGISCKLSAVSASVIRLIVGAHRKTEESVSTGAAYIYESTDFGNSWNFKDQLLPSVSNHKSFFGCSVDINDDIAIVGAHGDNTEGWRVGSVTIFREIKPGKWQSIRTLLPGTFSNNGGQSIRPTCTYFGFSVSLSKQFIAIGSPSERTQGSVYLFHTNDSWDSDNVLSHRIEGDNRFGFSVKLSEEQLIIGSPGVEGNPGKACIYNTSAFFDASLGFIPAALSQKPTYCDTLRTKSKSSKALFGRDVDIYDDFVVVSGFGKNDDEFVGSAFLFLKNNNKIDIEPVACIRDKNAAQLFGHSISINNKFVVVGDPTSDNVHVYLIRNLIAGNNKRWHNSSHCIEAPEEYLLEIH